MLWYILSLVFVFLLSVAGLRIWGDSKDSHGNTKLVVPFWLNIGIGWSVFLFILVAGLIHQDGRVAPPSS